MSGALEKLLQDKSPSETKSYLVGLERGRIWAEERADYFELREWSEADADEFDDLTLPHDEGRHFQVLAMVTPLEWSAYLKGWLEGVREIKQRY